MIRTLFPLDIQPAEIPPIPGLMYFPEYITQVEEGELATAVDAQPWDISWERRRQPYGGGYGRSKEPAPPIPDWGRALAARMHREGLVERPFDHMLVNEYLPGQGISLHCDYEPYDRIVASLSLLADCVMDFRSLQGSRREALLLKRRSLLVLSDDARYRWQHGIARRKNDVWQGTRIPRGRRLSITFRLLKQPIDQSGVS